MQHAKTEYVNMSCEWTEFAKEAVMTYWNVLPLNLTYILQETKKNLTVSQEIPIPAESGRMYLRNTSLEPHCDITCSVPEAQKG